MSIEEQAVDTAAVEVAQEQATQQPVAAQAKEAEQASDPYSGIVVESNAERVAEEQEKAIEKQDEVAKVEDLNADEAEHKVDDAKPTDSDIKTKDQLRLEAENAVLKAEAEQKSAAKEEPNVSDFDSLDEYLDAKADYDSSNQAAPEQVLSREERVAVELLKETLNQSRDKLPEDFDKKAFLHVSMVEAIADLDDPAAVMYHLGANIAEAERLLGLSPAKRAMEIAKLGASLAKSASKPVKPVKVSKAPDPINPVSAGIVKPMTLADAAKTDLSAYEAMRNAQNQKRSRFGW